MSTVHDVYDPTVRGFAKLPRLWRHMRRLEREGHIPALQQLLELIRLKPANGVGPAFYLNAGLYRRELSWDDKTAYVDGQKYWKLLTAINLSNYDYVARNKIVTEVRRRTKTQKHNVNRELKHDDPSDPAVTRVPSREPSPSQMAIAREQWDRLMSQQPTHYRKIVRLRLRGETYRSIADELHLSDKTVRRVLTKLLRDKVA